MITSDSATKEGHIECNTVVLAAGLQSEQELYRYLLSMEGALDLYVIGDATEPRKIHDAIWEGYLIGSKT